MWIFSLFHILVQIFMWASFMAALAGFAFFLRKAIKHEARFVDWLLLVISFAYGIFFIVGKFYFNDTLETIAAVIFVIIMIISTQMAKYEDRKAGRRWWTR